MLAFSTEYLLRIWMGGDFICSLCRCLFFYFYFSFNEVEGERLSQAFKTVTGVKRERERDMGGKYEQIHREIVARMGGGKKVKRATNPEKLHF